MTNFQLGQPVAGSDIIFSQDGPLSVCRHKVFNVNIAHLFVVMAFQQHLTQGK